MDEREVLTRFKAGTLERADAVRLLAHATARPAAPPARPAHDSAPPDTAAHDPAPRDTATGAADLDGVAVVGIAGRYPLAPDLDTFWENLREGRDTSRTAPAGRPGTTVLAAGQRAHFLDGAAEFDARFFGLTTGEGALMDPQERLFLETAWEAMEDAGFTGARLDTLTAADGRPRCIGVFAAATSADYALLAAEAWAAGGRRMPPSGHGDLPGTLQRLLNLTGPAQAVDAAASSGLAAVHLAVQALRRGECALAVAGGVELLLHPSRARHGAGEGVGAVVLRPLARALADGDRVHAVLRSTHAWSGPAPAPEGDLHETTPACVRRIGDAGAATGLAALTSAVLQLRHATLAPDRPGATARPWPRRRDAHGHEQPRVATVEASDPGGPAARAVVAEHLPPPHSAPAPKDPARPAEHILLSAPTPEHLTAAAGRLADWLDTAAHPDGPTLAEVARALRATRTGRPCRIALTAHDTRQLTTLLRRFAHRTDTAPVPQVRFADLRAGADPLSLAQAPETGDFLRALWRGGRTEQLVRLWLSGLDVDFAALQHRPGTPPPCPLPPTVFLRRELWLGQDTAPGAEPPA